MTASIPWEEMVFLRNILKVVWKKVYIVSVTVSQSGLTQAVRDSKITLEQAEYEFLSFVRQHTPPGQCPLAGELLFGTRKYNITAILLSWLGSCSHVLWSLFLQVTLCMRTRGSSTSTCHSLCTTSTTELLMSAPSRSFAGQCLCDCGFNIHCNAALFCECSVVFGWDCISMSE